MGSGAELGQILRRFHPSEIKAIFRKNMKKLNVWFHAYFLQSDLRTSNQTLLNEVKYFS